ncbi:MAG: 6-phosphogluconolactonase [Acidobacteriia bacterium]|nr:6-phosphogluconolactonase [Terriglobia bacterium]
MDVPTALQKPEIHIYPTLEEMSRAAAVMILQEGKEAITARGQFLLVLAGGSTPRSLYTQLSGDEFRPQLDWSKVHFFWGDERAVPPIHLDSNFRMARETLLSKISVSPTHIHRIPAEKTVTSEAAKIYAAELKDFFGLKEGEWPRFDLVLLGMGPEGHTASLFPNNPALQEEHQLVVAPWVEQLKCYRVTLTPPAINHSAQVVFFVAGEDKAAALHAVLKGEFHPETYPAQIIRPVAGRLTWILDRAAASQLSD